ncbi:MAG: CDP-glucose 4,6-dehydratase, partial [Sphingomonadaceae bacterium]
MRLPDRNFWAGQRILVTGHTGFKGSWTSLWLERLGADVVGLSLPPEQEPNLFRLLAPFEGQDSRLVDVRDGPTVAELFRSCCPTLVLHMAAQPLVRRSYASPADTFETNVMGTVSVLEAARESESVQAILVVTTDKVYENNGSGTRFREGDRLGGTDPYSASKVAAEVVTRSYAQSFLRPRGVSVATARAGNVIGGGDWSEDRLVADVWRAKEAGTQVQLRYPGATRPWQHVLDPILGYLLCLEDLVRRPEAVPEALNFGPCLGDENVTVADLVERLSA